MTTKTTLTAVYYRREDGIHYYHVDKPTRDNIDYIAKIMKANDQQDATDGVHACSIYGVRDMYITPYLLARAVETARSTPPDLHESIAIVTTDSITMSVARVFVNRLPQRNQSAFRIFRSMEEGIAWLNQRRQTDASSSGEI